MAEPRHTDTIYALSSGRGPAGVAVVRVSGPNAGVALREITHADLPPARKASLRQFRSPAGEVIDDGLVLWFLGPASFTGEDLVEFHVHGGRAVVDGLMEALRHLARTRPAEPGEFTRRAVENGKFDLTQAEALADLINAETEAQRRQALRQYEGSLGAIYEAWRQDLIRVTAWAEAAIDFADDELPRDILAKAREQAADLLGKMTAHLNDARRGEILREGFYLTVVGPPNSGKSSLVNALAKRDVAIVSDVPGTTRDVLEVHLDLAGYPVILADTAGLRPTAESIENEGVRRALERARRADAVLLLLDASAPKPLPSNIRPTIKVWNKIDLAEPRDNNLGISARTGDGIDNLITELGRIVSERLSGAAPSLTRERHRVALQEAAAALNRAMTVEEPEILAEELRIALRQLGKITGHVDVECLLDVIFREFCIGK